ncbi:MAG: hypothetical protein AB7O24_15990 [Kofleriaceae bacterium]
MNTPPIATVEHGDADLNAALRRRRVVRYLRRTVVAFLAIALFVPPIIIACSSMRIGAIGRDLQACEDAFGAASSTDGWLANAASNPLYREWANERRAKLLDAVVEGVETCACQSELAKNCAPYPDGLPAALFDKAAAFAASRIVEIAPARSRAERYGVRPRIERFLANRGYHRELTRVADRPDRQSSEVNDYVRAYLALGDAATAAVVASRPIEPADYEPGTLWCLSGDYNKALSALQVRYDGTDFARSWVPALAYAECSLAAGRADDVRAVLGPLDPPIKMFWLARLEAARGDAAGVLHELAAGRDARVAWQGLDARADLLLIWALAKQRNFAAIGGMNDSYTPGFWALRREVEQSESPRNFELSRVPIDEDLLRETVDILDVEAVGDARLIGGRLQLLLTSYLVERGDPTAPRALEKARRLLGAEAHRADALATAMWLFDGTWTSTTELRHRIHATYEDVERTAKRGSARDLTLMNGSLPSLFLRLADVLDGPGSAADKMALLRRGQGDTLLRLQMLIAAGRFLGEDVARDKGQLATLRELMQRRGSTLLIRPALL